MEREVVSFYPIFLYLFFIIGFAVTTLILAHVIGPKRRTKTKDMPYESGMDPVGDARQNFDVRFYLVAILFLVFDVELLYLYPWAVAAYNENRGVPAALSTAVFVITILFLAKLTIGYIYEWRKGGFNWR